MVETQFYSIYYQNCLYGNTKTTRSIYLPDWYLGVRSLWSLVSSVLGHFGPRPPGSKKTWPRT